MADITIKYRRQGAGLTAQRLDMMEAESDRVVVSISDTFFRGGLWRPSTCTTDYAAKAWDLILADPTKKGFTVQIPDPTTVLGAFILVKNVSPSTNPITIVVAKSKDPRVELIDGASSLVISTARGRCTLGAFSGPGILGWTVVG